MGTLPIRHSSDDAMWMRRALNLAREMRGYVWPNPPVGCVIVKNGTAVAEAATHAGGRPHAERKALGQAGAAAKGATLYVTLEPCCHWGQTPPCVDAIIGAGVSRVVCSIRDPDPRVNGEGFAALQRAGVIVNVGAYAEEAKQVMSGFLCRIQHSVPEVITIDRAPATIPIGIDSLAMSSQHGPQLLTRSGEIDIAGVKPHRLLHHMGEIGLTSVAVSRQDWLLTALSSSVGDELNIERASIDATLLLTRKSDLRAEQSDGKSSISS